MVLVDCGQKSEDDLDGREAVQGPRMQMTAFAGYGTVNKTLLQRRDIRTRSINGTRNDLPGVAGAGVPKDLKLRRARQPSS